MKIVNIRLFQELNQCFIFKADCPFTTWHHHPEFELCLITKGKGNRMVGDNIDQFKSNDLVFIGTYTPHEYIGDPKHFEYPDGFQEEAIVIQFLYDFLGDNFFRLPENSGLNRFILGSTRGYVFFGESKKKIISIMLKMQDMNEGERFYSLISIFKIFASTKEFRILSSLAFSESFSLDESGSMKKALKFISQNFQENIKIKDLLEITNMSNTSFFEKFKQTYRMPFKDYLLNIRVGYACKLLTDESQNISGIAYASGFGNISNFNRQFKKIKGITPSQFEEKLKKMRMKI